MNEVFVKGTVFFHILPKNDVNEDGQPVVHDVSDGADCWCEAICLAEFHPTKPKVPFYIIVHRQDKISCVTITQVKYKPPTDEEPPSASEDHTPKPKWNW